MIWGVPLYKDWKPPNEAMNQEAKADDIEDCLLKFNRLLSNPVPSSKARCQGELVMEMGKLGETQRVEVAVDLRCGILRMEYDGLLLPFPETVSCDVSPRDQLAMCPSCR